MEYPGVGVSYLVRQDRSGGSAWRVSGKIIEGV